MPEVSWICYLLHLSHMGLSWGAPGRHPESSWNPEPFTDLIFLFFLPDLGVHLEAQLAQFSFIFRVHILIQFLNGFLTMRLGWGSTVAAKPGLGWGGGFLAGDPFTGLTSNKGRYA